MKKILKWVCSVVLGIVPAMGAASSSDDASWLNKKDAIYSISEVYEDDERVMAIVDATFEDGQSRQLHVKAAFTPKGWDNNDEGLYARRTGNAIVFSNGKNEKPYTKEEEHAYTLIKSSTINLQQGNVLSDTDLPLGAMVEVHTQTEYLRPNQTPYSINQLLHQSIAVALVNGEIVKEPDDLFQKLTPDTPINVVKAKAEDIEKGAEFLLAYPVIYQVALMKDIIQRRSVRCYKEGDEISQWKKKWRHWWQYNTEIETTPKLYKILKDGQKVLYRSGTLRTQTVFHHQDEGRTNHDRCPNSGETW